MSPWKCESAPAPIACAMRWQSRSIGPGVLMSWSNCRAPSSGRRCTRCSRTPARSSGSRSPVQSSIFVSSGLKPAATEPPIVAVAGRRTTNSATWLICASFSFFENEGMPTPPFVTWRATAARPGGAGRGRARPFPSTSPPASVWQPPQPALSKTFAPGSELVEPSRALVSFPPQPARARRTRPKRAAPRRAMHARATFKRRAWDESSPNRTGLGLSPAGGYSLTLVGVVGKQPVREARLSWRSRLARRAGPLGLIALGLALGALSLADLHRQRLQPRDALALARRPGGRGCRVRVASARLAPDRRARRRSRGRRRGSVLAALPDRALSVAGPGQLGRDRDHARLEAVRAQRRRRSVRCELLPDAGPRGSSSSGASSAS